MKVSCLEHEEKFEIAKEDMTLETTITIIKCPICKGNANLKEIDVYVCFDCGLVWTVDYDFEDYKKEKNNASVQEEDN